MEALLLKASVALCLLAWVIPTAFFLSASYLRTEVFHIQPTPTDHYVCGMAMMAAGLPMVVTLLLTWVASILCGFAGASAQVAIVILAPARRTVGPWLFAFVSLTSALIAFPAVLLEAYLLDQIRSLL